MVTPVVSGRAEPSVSAPPLRPVRVEFDERHHRIEPGAEFTIGGESDPIAAEANSEGSRLLRLRTDAGLWWIENVGAVPATVSDVGGHVQARLAPGTRLPLVFEQSYVVVDAGPVSYEVIVHAGGGYYAPTISATGRGGDETVEPVQLTAGQRLLIVALAEPLLGRRSSGRREIPSSGEAAARLGWTLTAFNRKLDNVCDKLDRIGVIGLRGGRDNLATNRRRRLVEYAIATRLVTRDDLAALEAPTVGVES